MNGKKQLVGRLDILILAVAILAALVVGCGFVVRKTQLNSAWRDVLVAEYAHIRAGPRIPVDPKVVDDIEAGNYSVAETWGIITNSLWLAQVEENVVPYYYYLNINRPAYYPDLIVFVPMADESYFHLLGEEDTSAGTLDGVPGVYRVVSLNERMLNGNATDMRVLLATIVHEMIHAQGGAFNFSGKCSQTIQSAEDIACWNNESTQLESNTQSAAINVLAAMCNHQDELACKSFWYEIEDASSSSFEVWTWDHNMPWLYDFIDKTFWLTPGQAIQYDAAMRYWNSTDPESLKSIVQKYGKLVWQKTLWGVLDGWGISTGLPDTTQLPIEVTPKIIYWPQCVMRYADEQYIFGPLFINLMKLIG